MPVKKRKLLNQEDKLRMKAQIAKDKKEALQARLSAKLNAAERKLGRREFAVDEWTRLWVTRYKGCGYSHRTIAAAIGCDVNTLQKHFAHELEFGMDLAKTEVTAMIYRSADEGNVGAQRKLYSIMHGEVETVVDASDDAGKGKKIGKKEQQIIDAGKVESKYAPPEPPKLVANNKFN